MQTRIAGYDFARSLALFGLVVANFRGNVEHVELDLLYDLIRGGAIVAFLGLGGVGISLLKQRGQRTNDAHRSADSRRRLIKRAASLLVVGICCNVIWHDNFLCFYSICIAIGALLLTVSNRWLWSLAFIFVSIWAAFLFLIFDHYKIINEIIRNLEALWDSDPWTAEGMVFRLYVSRFHWIFYWTAFLLIGIRLGRQEVTSPNVRKVMFFGGVAVALVSCTPWLLIHYAPSLLRFVPLVPSRPSLENLSEPGINMMLFTLPYILGMCGTAAAIIGGSLMLTKKYPAAKWAKPFMATGQLALTLYVAHLVMGVGLLEALEVLDKTLPYALGSAVVFCICAVIFSHFWTKRFERGPLEWGMRRITG